jgi:polyisoprenoid-binding protein YceI
MRTWVKWLIGGLAVVVVAAVAVPWAYINFVKEDAAPRFQLSDEPVTTTTAAGGTSDTTAAGGGTSELSGTWTVASGSEVGYRVSEVLFGQDTEATGRTSDVTGSITLTDTTLTEGAFTADLTTVKSDEDRRDGQFQGNIMNTAEFPTATFKVTEPIDFGSPADGEKVTASATGELTMHGVTNTVTFDVEARKAGNVIEVTGSIPILFSDYDIANPSRAGITVKDNGEMEFLLTFNPA